MARIIQLPTSFPPLQFFPFGLAFHSPSSNPGPGRKFPLGLTRIAFGSCLVHHFHPQNLPKCRCPHQNSPGRFRRNTPSPIACQCHPGHRCRPGFFSALVLPLWPELAGGYHHFHDAAHTIPLVSGDIDPYLPGHQFPCPHPIAQKWQSKLGRAGFPPEPGPPVLHIRNLAQRILANQNHLQHRRIIQLPDRPE